jgi:hypothetical protein
MAVAAGYRDLASQLSDPDLFMVADEIRQVIETPGFKFVVDSIAEREGKMLARLLNESTRPEDIPRLRGLVAGLRSVHEAAESILLLADEREKEANRKVEHTL